MAADAHAAADFYATPRGAVAERLLCEHLTRLWPDLRGQSVLGVGFAEPYLRLWRGQATRCIALTPAQMGVTRWPLGEPNLSCTAEEDALPFPDLLFDRVLLVHGLEAAESARRMLRETWRVLKDDGRLLVVAPNRTGMWAYWESTPFGHGQPYSFGQIGRLLAASLYRVERRDAALYLP
ncbi:MAG TPA: methyltransferase domain-containing protein, partial [Acetobacteraceae bacterium]